MKNYRTPFRRLLAVVGPFLLTYGAFLAISASSQDPQQAADEISCLVEVLDPQDPSLDLLVAPDDSMLVTCEGGPPTAEGEPLPQIDLTVLYNVPVVDVNDAQLVLPGDRLLCGPSDPSFDPEVGSCFTTTPPEGESAYDGSQGRPNVFLAKPYGRSGVLFNNIPVQSGPSGGFSGLISGIEINMAALQQPGRELSSTTLVTQIDPEFSAERRAPAAGVSRAHVKKTARKRAKSKKRTAKKKAARRKAKKKKKAAAKKTARGGHGGSTNSSITSAIAAAVLEVVEALRNSARAKTPRMPIRASLRSEDLHPAQAEEFDPGTRYCASISSVPRGIRVFVTDGVLTTSTPGAGAMRTASADGPFEAVPTTGTLRMAGQEYELSEVTLSRGQGEACWEVTSSDPTVLEKFEFGIVPSWRGDGTFAGSPDEGTAFLQFRSEPMSTVGAISYAQDSPSAPLYVEPTPPAAGDPNVFPIFTAHSSSGAPARLEFGQPFRNAPTLIYNVQQNGNIPPVVSIPVLSPTNQARLSISADIDAVQPLPQQAMDGWLTATLSGGEAPDAIEVDLDVAGLPVGDHNGRITIRSTGAGNSPLVLPLLVRVTPPGPYFDEGTLLNAAGFQPGAVSPGMAFVIFGSGFGGSTLDTLVLGPDGRVASELGGVRVLFDGTPAPMIFTVNGQISGFTPFSVADRATTIVTIEFDGQTSRPITLPVLDSTPALFTIDATGGGPAAALNEDGSVNQHEVQAEANEILVFFGTGGGQTNPEGVDGQIAGLPLPELVQDVEVLIGGLQAEVLYAGPAPGLAEGVIQINVRLPPNVTPGLFVEVRIRIGAQWSQPGVTIAVSP